MSVEKRAIRQALRARRRSLPTAFVEAASLSVCSHLRTFQPLQSAASLIAYVAHENEVSVAPFLEEAASHARLFLPRHGPDAALVRWRPGDLLTAGPDGILRPLGVATAIDLPAVALVPLVAWDRLGARLGRGGGFYDRIFATLTGGCVRVGLAYEFQEWPDLPQEPWDVPLHYVITEQRVVRCGGKAVAAPPLQKGGIQL